MQACRMKGFNMSLADEGAAAYLQDALGTTYPLVVDTVGEVPRQSISRRSR